MPEARSDHAISTARSLAFNYHHRPPGRQLRQGKNKGCHSYKCCAEEKRFVEAVVVGDDAGQSRGKGADEARGIYERYHGRLHVLADQLSRRRDEDGVQREKEGAEGEYDDRELDLAVGEGHEEKDQGEGGQG